MNKRQKIIILVGTALICLIGLYPPFTFVVHDPTFGGEVFAGYSFILLPPKPKGQSYLVHVKVDVERLAVQWVLVILVVTGLVVAMKN